jgi:hypothetical protein
MAKHHLVLTEDEFAELVQLELTPLDKLRIKDEEKRILLEQARMKQPGDTPERLPVVICGFVDDAVVCVVVPH